MSGPLLLYQPPLLDILPMYVVFLALTPVLLQWTDQRGFGALWAASAVLWLLSQCGGRSLLHTGLRALTGVPLSLGALGAFDLLAWQLLWVSGLWAGATRGERFQKPALFWVSALAVAGFALWRHKLAGFTFDLGARAARG